MATFHPPATLQDLHSVLEIYGADRTRWPAAVRLRLAHVITSEPLARQALTEAAALDALLDLAPHVSVEREQALALKIVAAAVAQAQEVAAPRLGETAASVVARKPRSLASTGSFVRHAGAVLLAASLVLGIFAGASGQLSPTFDAVADVLGLGDDEPEIAFVPDQQISGEDAL